MIQIEEEATSDNIKDYKSIWFKKKLYFNSDFTLLLINLYFLMSTVYGQLIIK